MSIVTVGELLGSAKQRGWGQARVEQMTELLGELVVVDINDAVVQHYAVIHDFIVKSGKTVGDNDV